VSKVHFGRVATVRIGPNEDLVAGLEAAAAQLGFVRALVRSGLGSLIDVAFERGARQEGPGFEIACLYGELGPDGAGVSGVVGDPAGHVTAGRFLRGANPVCVTIEAVLEEILPDSA
jgi:uncharacterized protein